MLLVYKGLSGEIGVSKTHQRNTNNVYTTMSLFTSNVARAGCVEIFGRLAMLSQLNLHLCKVV